ncbi:C39 family peptidase [uncultured Clostridium sp.]|uniref:C39 family peptidase n=1 Tax=uncultured Clostridium sp. TaxID=59620 RepID=UPI0025DA5533|nr:C39 family peptidase [uncultured Clostridium sp.]
MKKLFINGIVCSILAVNMITGGIEANATVSSELLNSVNKEESLIATDLLTNMYGSTPFPGTWKTTLDTDRPGNNYTAKKGISYSTLTSWTNELRNSIIYTIDKGYPVIADCLITTDTNTKIHSGYDYQTSSKSTYHYVVVVGYDDTVSPMKLKIVDSHPFTSIPTTYWTTVSKLGAATKSLGIMW